MKPRSVIVTGGAGFLGEYVVEELRNKYPDAIIHVPRSATCDLRDREQTHAFFATVKPTHVFHLATPSGGVALLKERPQEVFGSLLSMGLNVLDASAHASVKRVIFAGSATSYPATAHLPYSEKEFWNGYPDEMEAPYGMAHKASIAYAKLLSRVHGLTTTYAVLSNLYGPRARFDHTAHVIPSMIKKFETAIQENKSSVELWGTGKALREFLYVQDAARILVQLLELETPEVLNVGSGEEVSIKTLAELISTMMAYTGNLAWNPTKPEGRLRRVLDSTFAQTTFGLTSPTSFEEGLAKTIAWYQSSRA